MPNKDFKKLLPLPLPPELFLYKACLNITNYVGYSR